MDHFNRFYSQAVLDGILRQIPADKRDKDVAYFLTGQNEGAQMRRECLNKYLELGQRHNAIDADLTRRLQSADWEQFIQARNELMAAWFVEVELRKTIQFRPQGNGQSVGEFEIITGNEENIFVEVK